MLSRSGCAALARSARRSAVRCFAAAPQAVPKLNFNKALVKAHEGKALREVVKLPPGALQGLREGKADEMLAAFNVKTIADLAAWKHYRAARAISVLAATEEEGKRPECSPSNVNGIVDKAFEGATLRELLAAPPSALQGLAPWADGTLAQLGVKSVEDLARWKFAAWADAMVTLAEYERDDFGSR